MIAHMPAPSWWHRDIYILRTEVQHALKDSSWTSSALALGPWSPAKPGEITAHCGFHRKGARAEFRHNNAGRWWPTQRAIFAAGYLEVAMMTAWCCQSCCLSIWWVVYNLKQKNASFPYLVDTKYRVKPSKAVYLLFWWPSTHRFYCEKNFKQVAKRQAVQSWWSIRIRFLWTLERKLFLFRGAAQIFEICIQF